VRICSCGQPAYGRSAFCNDCYWPERRKQQEPQAVQEIEVALPEGICVLCGSQIEGRGTCEECRAELYVPPRPRPERYRTAEQRERKRALDRASKRRRRADPAYHDHETARRRERHAENPERHNSVNRAWWHRNKSQLATVTQA
jgi:hypothetical protein